MVLIIVLTKTYSLIDFVVEQKPPWAIFPFSNAGNANFQSEIGENSVASLANIILFLQILFLLFLAYLALMLGRNSNTNEKNNFA
jgi:hypothetical protein